MKFNRIYFKIYSFIIYSPLYYYILLLSFSFKNFILYYTPGATPYKIFSWASHLAVIFWGLFRSIHFFKKNKTFLGFEAYLILVFLITTILASHFSLRSIAWAITFFVFSISVPIELILNKMHKHIEMMLKIVIYYGAALALINAIILLSGYSFELNVPYKKIGIFHGRFWGITGNPNRDAIIYAVSIMILCLKGIISTEKHQSLKEKIFGFTTSVLIWVMLIFSFSRASFLIILIFLIFLFFILLKDNSIPFNIKFKLTQRSIKILFVVCIISFSVKNFLGENLNRNISESGSNGRTVLWKKCLNSFKKSSPKIKFLGGGMENIFQTCSKHNIIQISPNNNMHNFVLQALIGGGLFGALVSLYLSFKTLELCFFFFKKSIFNNLTFHKKYFFVGSASISLTLLLHGLLDVGALFSANLICLFFWIAKGSLSEFKRSSNSSYTSLK